MPLHFFLFLHQRHIAMLEESILSCVASALRFVYLILLLSFSRPILHMIVSVVSRNVVPLNGDNTRDLRRLAIVAVHQ